MSWFRFTYLTELQNFKTRRDLSVTLVKPSFIAEKHCSDEDKRLRAVPYTA